MIQIIIIIIMIITIILLLLYNYYVLQPKPLTFGSERLRQVVSQDSHPHERRQQKVVQQNPHRDARRSVGRLAGRQQRGLVTDDGAGQVDQHLAGEVPQLAKQGVDHEEHEEGDDRQGAANYRDYLFAFGHSLIRRLWCPVRFGRSGLVRLVNSPGRIYITDTWRFEVEKVRHWNTWKISRGV